MGSAVNRHTVGSAVMGLRKASTPGAEGENERWYGEWALLSEPPSMPLHP